jgi:chorismate-pyruvate lyase
MPPTATLSATRTARPEHEQFPGIQIPRRLLAPARIRPVALSSLVPGSCLPWIRLNSSMTREIGRALGKHPEVHLLKEGPDRISRWEAEQLGLPARGRAYAREVALTVQGQLALLARSLADPDDPVAGVLRRLQRTPLAEVLFQDSRWQRKGAPLPLRWRAKSGVIYGRACLWQRRGRQPGHVLVEEYFLAPLLAAS